jgi:serine protease Do
MGTAAGKMMAVMVMSAALFAQAAAPSASQRPPQNGQDRARSTKGAYLGVDIRDLTAERASELKLPNAGGVEITMVDQDAPAAKAGLREQDVIVSFDGQKIDSAEQLRQRIRAMAPGASAKIGFLRAGQPMDLTVKLASRKQMLASPGGRTLQPPAMHPPIASDFAMPQLSVVPFWAHDGLIVEDLTPQLGEFLGVRNGDGVLVRSVEKGSVADAAGLRAGDVIVKVDGEQITCSSDWRHAMRQHKAGSVTLGVVRDKREQAVTMKIPERRTGSLRIDLPDMTPVLEEMSAELERMRPQIERTVMVARSEFLRAAEEAMRQAVRQLEQARREQESQQQRH